MILPKQKYCLLLNLVFQQSQKHTFVLHKKRPTNKAVWTIWRDLSNLLRGDKALIVVPSDY